MPIAGQKGFHIAVGTPGRVLDHLARGTLSLEGVRYVVLDEADRMLDIGFRPDIEKILRRCPSKRQTLLLSATLPPPVLRLAQRYMRDPLHINLSPSKVTVENIRQSFITVDEDKKFDLLLRVMERERRIAPRRPMDRLVRGRLQIRGGLGSQLIRRHDR